MATSAEKPGYTAIVRINGTISTALKCISVTSNLGSTPTSALFLQSFGRDVAGPVALQPYNAPSGLKYGTRVSVVAHPLDPMKSDVTLFAGWLMKRQDQGGPDKILWTAYDDRVLLQWFPVRGCIVWDPIDKTIKYSERHPCVFNPGGFWNCTGYTWGDGHTYPVFTEVAYRALAYESPLLDYSGRAWAIDDPGTGDYFLTAGCKHQPWTPRRALAYLQFYSIIKNDTSPTGLDMPYQPALSQTARLSGVIKNVEYSRDDIINMAGYDPADVTLKDPLDRKLVELDCQGGTVLAAVDKVLKAAGTHSFITTFSDSSPDDAKFDYALTGYAPDNYSGYQTVTVQRSGNVGELGDSSPNCYDFNFEEDATQQAEKVLTEGDIVRVETRLAFAGPPTDVATNDYSGDTTSEIIPAWNYDDEVAFLECIHGSGSSPYYAKRARVHNDATTLELCDGGSGRPIAFARTPEAVQIARECFPQVFRAWKINGKATTVSTLVALGGSNGGLKGVRPILPEQLQFMIRNLGGGSGVENWLLVKLPVRVQLLTYPGSSDYVDVPMDISARVTPDGYIWLDGLAESASGTGYCCTYGNLLSQDDYAEGRLVVRKMRINAALPTDTRVGGLASASSPITFDDELRGMFTTNPFLKYADAKETYQYGIQYNSFPTYSPYYYGGGDSQASPPVSPREDGNATTGLSRDVPPGSEGVFAELASKRTLARLVNPSRSASFALIGINPGWSAGSRVKEIVLDYPGGATYNYPFRGYVGTVEHNFVAQQTTLGGGIAEFEALGG